MNDTKKENFQIYSVKQRLVPNFKLCKVIYNLNQDQYSRMVEKGQQRRILEKKKYKRFGNIITDYRIFNSDDYDNTDPLNEFDYAVYSVCVSYFDKGYKCITVAIIYRALTGKGNTSRVTPDLREAILNSLKKLIGTFIEIDETDVNEVFKYAEPDKARKRSSILPAHFIDKTINGQDASVVFFDRESPLMEIAHQRRQLLTYDVSLLNAPGIRNTVMNIMLKNCVMRRVAEIKIHKQLKPTVTFEDIFRKCRLGEGNRDTKMNARKIVTKFFEHLQSEKVIKSFEASKQENAFQSISFIY